MHQAEYITTKEFIKKFGFTNTTLYKYIKIFDFGIKKLNKRDNLLSLERADVFFSAENMISMFNSGYISCASLIAGPFRPFMINHTKFLDEKYENVSLEQRAWHIKHNILNIKICECCHQNKARWLKYEYGYCNNECKIKATQKNILITCTRLYGSHSSKADSIKKKISDTNIKKYGFSSSSKNPTILEKIKKYACDNREVSRKKSKDSKILMYTEKYKNAGYNLIRYDTNLIILHHIKCDTEFSVASKTASERLICGNEICIHCNPLKKGYSSGELQVMDYIASFYDGKVLSRSRKIIYPLELDIYIPEFKIAIEYNGTYYHADPRFYKANDSIRFIGKIRIVNEIWNNDIKKLNRCKEIGIKLVTVWEYDWTKDNDNIKLMISKLFI